VSKRAKPRAEFHFDVGWLRNNRRDPETFAPLETLWNFRLEIRDAPE